VIRCPEGFSLDGLEAVLDVTQQVRCRAPLTRQVATMGVVAYVRVLAIRGDGLPG
jgi:hypothetical protein